MQNRNRDLRPIFLAMELCRIPAHPWLVQIALKRIFLIFKLSFNKPGIQENDMLRKVAIDMKTFRARENKMQFWNQL